MDISESLQKYYKAYDEVLQESYADSLALEVSPFFVPDSLKVNASDFAAVFEKVNASVLRDALNIMRNYCRELKIDTESQKHFRVLMAGGFSSLYCVESEVRKAFSSTDGVQDLRFDDGIPSGDRGIAIAGGAAILATGRMSVHPVCQTEIGIYYYDCVMEAEASHALVSRDRLLEEYREPRYFEKELRVNRIGRKTTLRLYFDDGFGKIPIRMEESFYSLCPDIDNPKNRYQVGISLSRSGIPCLHIRDCNGTVHSESLNREDVAHLSEECAGCPHLGHA